MAERDMNEIRHYLIYMYTFPNGKKYIGKSTKSMHRRQGNDWNRYSNCTLLWKAIQKYGTDNIETTILFEGDISHNEAAELERKYIAEYKTNANRYRNPQYGYNLTDGGEGLIGWHPSPERAEQMRKQLEGTNEKRLAALRSEKTRKKMSEAKKGKSYKKIKVKLTDTRDNSVQIFESHLAAANFFGVHNGQITLWIEKGYLPKKPYYLIENYMPGTTEASGDYQSNGN